MDEDERWAAIPGFSRYEASSLGNIRRAEDRYRMKLLLNGGGYLSFSLRGDDKKNHSLRVHRCVALAFLPNVDNLPTVDHTDRDKVNNTLDNLRWASMTTQNTNKTYSKQNCKRRKVNQINMTTGEVEKVWDSVGDASRATKTGHISSVCRGDRRYANGFFWEYTEQPLLEGEEFRQAFTDHTRDTHIEKTFVSNFGRIRKQKGRITVGTLDAAGYPITMCGNTRYLISRLVAFSWLDYVEGCTIVNHIDLDKANNNADNLRWFTGSENTILNAIHGNAQEIEQYSLKGDLLYTYPCRSVAVRETKIPKNILDGALKPTTLRSKGYIFKYKDMGDPIDVILTKIRAILKRVIQYDLQMNEIARFESVSDTSRQTGIYLNTILGHLNRKTPGPCKGQFYFKYEE